jgi:hypothetical protein
MQCAMPSGEKHEGGRNRKSKHDTQERYSENPSLQNINEVRKYIWRERPIDKREHQPAKRGGRDWHDQEANQEPLAFGESAFIHRLAGSSVEAR